MSHYLARLVSGKTYRTLRNRAKDITQKLPTFFREGAGSAKGCPCPLNRGGRLGPYL